MIDRLERPFRPHELQAGTLTFFSLPQLASDLRAADEYVHAGVSAVTLARDEHVTVVLVALRKGSAMREHHAPSASTVAVLAGRVAFVADREPRRTELGPGELAAFAADLPHAIEALEDAAYLVTIGGRSRDAHH